MQNTAFSNQFPFPPADRHRAARFPFGSFLERQRLAAFHAHQQVGEVERDIQREPFREQGRVDENVFTVKLYQLPIELLLLAVQNDGAAQDIQRKQAVLAHVPTAGAPVGGIYRDIELQRPRELPERQQESAALDIAEHAVA